MKVGFFLLHFPVFSETFVSKEILTLQKLGVKGVIVCEKQNHTPPLHPHIKNINFPIIEISQKIINHQFFTTLTAHLYWLFRKPIGYLKSIYILFHFLCFHHLRVFIKAPELARKLESESLNLIYVHEVDSPCLYGLICGQLLNIPCGIIFHTQYLLAQNKYLRPKIKFTNFTIFQSKYSQEIAGHPQNSTVISTPGIDTNFFSPVPKPIFPEQIRLITIGRLEEAKGYKYLLPAIKILTKKYPDILLTIVGDGTLKSQFQKYIIKNNLQKNIKLLGFIPQNKKLINIIQKHQYFILPSVVDSQGIHDVHPNVVKEAMSCGLITITSKLGGINEIIKNNQNGFLINKISFKNIANKISRVHQLSTIQKIKIMKSAHQTIINHHQQIKICQKLKEVFTKSL